MEFCHQLREMFTSAADHPMAIEDLREYVNTTLDKTYSTSQIIIGMDYAGFVRRGENYLVEVADSDRSKS